MGVNYAELLHTETCGAFPDLATPAPICRLAVYPIEAMNDFYLISFLKGFWIDVLTYDRDFRSWVNQEVLRPITKLAASLLLCK